MSKTTRHQSSLDTFTLSFEYDMSWSDAKKQVKERSS